MKENADTGLIEHSGQNLGPMILKQGELYE